MSHMTHVNDKNTLTRLKAGDALLRANGTYDSAAKAWKIVNSKINVVVDGVKKDYEIKATASGLVYIVGGEFKTDNNNPMKLVAFLQNRDPEQTHFSNYYKGKDLTGKEIEKLSKNCFKRSTHKADNPAKGIVKGQVDFWKWWKDDYKPSTQAQVETTTQSVSTGAF